MRRIQLKQADFQKRPIRILASPPESLKNSLFSSLLRDPSELSRVFVLARFRLDSGEIPGNISATFSPGQLVR